MRKKTTEIVMISLFAALTAVGAFIRSPFPMSLLLCKR